MAKLFAPSKGIPIKPIRIGNVFKPAGVSNVVGRISQGISSAFSHLRFGLFGSK